MNLQKQLELEYQNKLDMVNEYEFFEDASMCDVCGSDNVLFTEMLNGVIRTCGSCEDFYKLGGMSQ